MKREGQGRKCKRYTQFFLAPEKELSSCDYKTCYVFSDFLLNVFLLKK